MAAALFPARRTSTAFSGIKTVSPNRNRQSPTDHTSRTGIAIHGYRCREPACRLGGSPLQDAVAAIKCNKTLTGLSYKSVQCGIGRESRHHLAQQLGRHAAGRLPRKTQGTFACRPVDDRSKAGGNYQRIFTQRCITCFSCQRLLYYRKCHAFFFFCRLPVAVRTTVGQQLGGYTATCSKIQYL